MKQKSLQFACLSASLCLLFGAAVGVHAQTTPREVGQSASSPSFSVIAETPVQAVVVVPAAEDVSALYAGGLPGAIGRVVTDWRPTAAGLLVADVQPEDGGWYRAVYEDGRELLVGPRHVPVVEGRNFRDLGGYTTLDGSRVRPGRLFRSGYLSDLAPGELERLQGLGISRICDFRSKAERASQPDPDLPGWQQIQGCQAGDASDSFAALAALAERARMGEPVDWRGLIVSSYAKMGRHYAPAFRALFDSILQHPDEPVLFHCTAGKDRTGIAAALLLLALGVPEEQVIADYTMSEMDPVSDVTTDAYPEELVNQPDLQATDAEYIRSALDGIRLEHGSVEAYLREVMGLDEARLVALRSALLDMPE